MVRMYPLTLHFWSNLEAGIDGVLVEIGYSASQILFRWKQVVTLSLLNMDGIYDIKYSTTRPTCLSMSREAFRGCAPVSRQTSVGLSCSHPQDLCSEGSSVRIERTACRHNSFPDRTFKLSKNIHEQTGTSAVRGCRVHGSHDKFYLPDSMPYVQRQSEGTHGRWGTVPTSCVAIRSKQCLRCE